MDGFRRGQTDNFYPLKIKKKNNNNCLYYGNAENLQAYVLLCHSAYQVEKSLYVLYMGWKIKAHVNKGSTFLENNQIAIFSLNIVIVI